jgi:uncharacterized linocin/CFP29 family protein
MPNKYLAREDAPFGSEVWDKLDEVMKTAAKSQLVGRRLLDVEGPYGLGLKAVPLPDPEMEDDSGITLGGVLPLAWIEKVFTLGVRDLAAYERDKVVLSTSRVAEAAVEAARLEDELIFHGAGGMDGLMTVEGANQVNLSGWEEVGTAADEIIGAITTLDEAGFHGPYALALAPGRYNALFRLYGQQNRSELEHIRMMVTDGIYKAPILNDGGVLVATGRLSATIVLGQDMTVGFIGPVGPRIEMTISESLTLRIRRPNAICVLA